MSTGISGKKINPVASSIRRGGGETMKKILVIAIATMMVVGLAAVAQADTNGQWLIYLKITDQNNANGVINQNIYGCNTGKSDGAAAEDAANTAGGLTSTYLASFDIGAGSANQGYNKDIRSVGTSSNKWNLKIWLGTSAINTGIKLIGWNPSGTYGMSGDNMQMHLRVASVPAGLLPTLRLNGNPVHIGDEFLFANKTYGTSAAPEMTWLFTDTRGQAGQGGFAEIITSNPPATACIGLELVPEPGSMLAMLSGLVGLVGYGIRRRK